MTTRMTALIAAGCMALAGPVLAQTPRAGCTQAAPTAAATPPAQGAASGTAPGGMGSSGWSGGTGGSYIGTAPAGPTSGSAAQHPAVAQGLDPTKPSAPSNDQGAC